MYIETKELRKALKVFDLLGESRLKFEFRGNFLYISNIKNEDNSYDLKVKLPIQINGSIFYFYCYSVFSSLEIEIKPIIKFLKIIRSKLINFYISGTKGNQYLHMNTEHIEHGICLKDINNKELNNE